MSETTMVCASIITFNCDIVRLQQNIEGIYKQVDKVIIIDNGSQNIGDIGKLIRGFPNLQLICNPQNEGIARALNQAVLVAKECGYQWILTLDQDSVCYDNLIVRYLSYTKFDRIGMIICDVVDRNYKLKEKRYQNEYDEVDKCITSGCFMNIEACIASGMFDEKLFVDSVDYDMCYSMIECGYRIINVHFVGLLHEVGKSEKHSLFGYEFAVNNHPAERKYYISRNSTYLIKKHRLNMIKEYFVIYRRIFTVLFFEKDKWNKINSILRGIKEGRKM